MFVGRKGEELKNPKEKVGGGCMISKKHPFRMQKAGRSREEQKERKISLQGKKLT